MSQGHGGVLDLFLVVGCGRGVYGNLIKQKLTEDDVPLALIRINIQIQHSSGRGVA